MKCKRHPKYRGLRIPRARDKETGALCDVCMKIFSETRAEGIRETRAERRSKAVVNEVEQQDVSTEEVVAEKSQEVDVENKSDSILNRICDEVLDDDECACEDADWESLLDSELESWDDDIIDDEE